VSPTEDADDGGGSAAWVLEAPGPLAGRPLRWRSLAAPVPGPGDVLIDVAACAVCRTDLQLCEGDLPSRKLPVVPGHQVVGRVSALGPGVADAYGVGLGDRVGVAWIAGTCGRCRACLSGRENLCVDATFTGWDVDGGFAGRMTAQADFVYALPPGITDVAAAPLLCGGAIGYRSLRVAEVTGGQHLGLYGFGASATCTIQVARHWGCEVYVCTRSPAEQARARELGAVWAGSYDERPPVELDAAITFAPSGDVVVAALGALARGGIVAVNAIHLDRIPQFPYELLWWERQLRSVANVTRRDVAELLALAVEVPIATHTEVFDLAGAESALGRLAAGDIRGAAVLRVP
jgi:propanol-preferring alcohol dehydrogenase